MNPLAVFIGRWKVRFFRGIAFASIVSTMLVIMIAVRQYEDWFAAFGIPLRIGIIIVATFFVVLCLSGGFVDEKLNTWAAENSHINQNLNPEFKVIYEWVMEQKKKEMLK